MPVSVNRRTQDGQIVSKFSGSIACGIGTKILHSEHPFHGWWDRRPWFYIDPEYGHTDYRYKIWHDWWILEAAMLIGPLRIKPRIKLCVPDDWDGTVSMRLAVRQSRTPRSSHRDCFSSLVGWLVFNSTFSTNRLQRAIWVWKIPHIT